MNRKLLVIFIVLVVSAAVIFTVKYFDKKKNSTEDFNTVLMAVDQSLKENSNENTRSLLLKVKIESLNLRETKRLIKRVFKYSQINGNYSLLETKSKECIKEFPNDTEFKAIYVFSTIKNGKYETAYKYSKNNISDSKFYTLKEESILLGSDGNNTDKKNELFSNESLLNVPGSKSANLYKNASELTGNDGFNFDAALISLRTGEPAKALKILKKIPKTFPFRNKLLFFSAYESGEYQEALRVLNTYDLGLDVHEFFMYKTDLLMASEAYSSAKNEYIQYIRKYPDESWIPYANLAWIGKNEHDQNLFNTVVSGFKYFKENIDYTRSVVSYLIVINRKSEALRYIKLYGNSDPLLSITFLNLSGAVEPDKLIARLQEFIINYTGNDKIEKYYCWFLFKTGNLKMLESFLEKAENGEGLSSWMKVFKGLIEVSKGHFDIADNYFRSSYIHEKYWELVFNLGLVEFYEKDYKKAVEYYQNAENYVSGIKPLSSAERSMIRTNLALALVKLGNRKRAVKELKYAQEMDRSNMRAVLELNKLESEQE